MRLIILFVFLFNQGFSQINTSYVVKNVADLNGEMYANAKQISTTNCRKSIDGSKLVLKFEGETPEIFKDDQIYGHDAIMQVLSTDQWTGYSGGIASVGKFLITDYTNKKHLQIHISSWMQIQPVRIKDNFWVIPYDVYLKYKKEVDGNIDLYKCVIRNVKKNELIEQQE